MGQAPNGAIWILMLQNYNSHIITVKLLIMFLTCSCIAIKIPMQWVRMHAHASPFSHLAGQFAYSDPGLLCLQHQSLWFCRRGGRAAADTQWTRTRWRQPPGCNGTGERRKRDEWRRQKDGWQTQLMWLKLPVTVSHNHKPWWGYGCRVNASQVTVCFRRWMNRFYVYIFLSVVYSQCARLPPLSAHSEVCEHSGVPQGGSQLGCTPRCHVIQPLVADGQCTLRQHYCFCGKKPLPKI